MSLFLGIICQFLWHPTRPLASRVLRRPPPRISRLCARKCPLRRELYRDRPCAASVQWSASWRVSPSRAAQVERGGWSPTPVFQTELEELGQRDATLKVVQRHGAGHRRLGLRRCPGGLCFCLDTCGDARKCQNGGRQYAVTPSASCRRDKAHCNPPVPHSLHQSSRA